jgi:DNA polymerase-3 subunit alpha
MNVARIVAGYSLGQADMLRRAMGKKKADEMAHHREIFLIGAKERGYDVNTANDLFDKMEKFAEYGFNKSHAVAYSVISYQTAFLKCYYPAEFFAALLSSELGNMEKITQYISDAKRFGVEVLPPDVNESLWPFNVVSPNIRFGMGAVKNVGNNAVEEIVKERSLNGAFTSFINFCERVNLKNINTRVIESLIKVGAFDNCEKYNRKTLLENLEMILAYCKKRQEENSLGLVSLFDMGEGDSGVNQTAESNLDIQVVSEFDELEKLNIEAELMGIYISGHPLDRYASLMKELATMPVASVQDFLGSEERTMTLAGKITAKKVILTKKGDKMCFATLEDLTGGIECIVFPKTFAEYEMLLSSDEPLLIEGLVKLAESPRKILANKITKLKVQAENKITGVRINVNLEDLTEMKLNKLRQVLLSYRGSIPMHLILESTEGRARLPLGEQYLINPTPQMAHQVNEVFNKDAVKFIIDGRVEDLKVDGAHA